MKVAITGITGNMGQATLAALEGANFIDKLHLLAHTRSKMKKLIKKHKNLAEKTVIIEGSVSDAVAVKKLINGVDVVINMAAVIPPTSDHAPKKTEQCNIFGVKTIVNEIEKIENFQPALLHISTVALYGNRTGDHRFGRVGDPLLVSPFDVYAATKLRGEFCVLESLIKNWVIFRQSAMLHPQMLADNISDGLMFHTCFDAPLEWVTAHDSGVLIRNFLEKFASGNISKDFMKKVYNIGNADNRCYGFDTLNDGFALIGGSAKSFFDVGYNATRNFHGMWFADGHILNDNFNYVSQNISDYWQEILKAHPIYKAGRAVPKKAIKSCVIKKLRKDLNAPAYWAKHNDGAKLIAYFGGKQAYDELQTKSWDDINILDRNEISEINPDISLIEYGFDINKSDSEIDVNDLKNVAEAHGGKLLSDNFEKGDMYAKVLWQTQDGENFTATPYSVLRAGHWYNPIYDTYVWDFDRLSKKDRIFAAIWYDSHGKDENYKYWLDENYNSKAEKIN